MTAKQIALLRRQADEYQLMMRYLCGEDIFRPTALWFWSV